MALPADSLSTTAVIADYESPYDRYTNALEDFEAGGVALNDGTQGLDIQIWYLTYDADEESPNYGDFTVSAEETLESAVIINVPGVVRVGLAFDQNMAPFIAYEDNTCGAHFYWYDSFIADYTTTTLPANSHYVACCLDDHRQTQTGSSDIILAYIRSGTLYYRQQRDRYEIEYALTASAGAAMLYKVGMTKNLRLKFDLREGLGVRLSEIVGNLCERVRVSGAQIDVGDLYPTYVRGFTSAGQYAAADSIRSLQKTYFFDFPEVDGKLMAVPRGGEIVATISQDELVADREFRFETAREQGVEFPKKLHLAYASAETDYTPTKATSERRSRDVQAQSEMGLDTAVNFEAQEAFERADILHKVAWAEFEGKARFSLPESFAYLTPSDLISLEVRTDTYKRLRLDRMTCVDGAFDCEAVIDRQSAYTSGAVAPPVTVAPETPPATIPGDTTWEFMDLPALITAHDTLHVYLAGHGDAGTAWHGARVQREVGADWETFGDILTAELMGEVAEAVGYAPAEFIDTTNTVLLTLNGTPSSTTTDLMLAGKGAWLLGDEIVQIRDWIAEGADWRGSYLFRGRLDTAAATHIVGTRAVYLGNPVRVQVDGALLDTDLTLRAPSYGQAGADAADAPYTFAGRSQEEWPPEMLTATQDGNDWVLSWVPRYRLGNSANPIPSAHFYGWRLTFAVGSDSVVYDVASITPEYTWTDAQQTADFGSAQATFDLDIQGLNYLGGPGKTLSESVS